MSDKDVSKQALEHCSAYTPASYVLPKAGWPPLLGAGVMQVNKTRHSATAHRSANTSLASRGESCARSSAHAGHVTHLRLCSRFLVCWWGVKPAGKLQRALPSQVSVRKGSPVGSCRPHNPLCPTACTTILTLKLMLTPTASHLHPSSPTPVCATSVHAQTTNCCLQT